MHVVNEQLIACLDHEEAYLDLCLACGESLEPYQSLQRDLLQALYRRDCPPTQTLSDYHFGFLSPAQSARIDAHLAECPHCAAELVGLMEFLETVRSF